jgi:flagellar hook-associated protein 1 FlgK
LGGVMKIYNNTIPGYLTKLDELASALITNVNSIHASGYGIGTPPPTGLNFFAGADARSIALDPAVVSNINNIASSADGSPGNNAIALQIAQLQNQTVMNSNTSTMFQFYNGVISGLGAEIQSSQTESESQILVLEQLQTQQNSVSGVSLDEEMTNLIKYQHGFDAAARVISTVDEMFESLLNM